MKRKNYFKKSTISLLFILSSFNIFGQTVDLYKIQTNPNATNTVYVTFINDAKAAFEANPASLKLLLDNVSDVYSPFDVNFTSDENIYNNTLTQNRARIAITERSGGIATQGSFGDPSVAINAAVGYNSLPTSDPNHFASVAAVFCHELGHTLSLVHDACPSNTGCLATNYLDGGGYWTPLMGLIGTSSKTTIHFYNGYKSGSHTNVDDIALAGSTLGFVPDDIDTISMILSPTGGITTSNFGVIQGQQDQDYFSFKTDGGNINILIKNALDYIPHPTLKVGAKVFNTAGQEVLTGTEEGVNSMHSRLTGNLPAGRYYIQIDGIGHKVNGGYTDISAFTDYSSHGAFYISGTITNGVSESISDISITDKNNLPQINCGNNLDFSTMISNNGTVPLTSVDVSIKSNGTLINSFTQAINLAPKEKVNIPISINTTISGELVVTIVPTGKTDPTLSNNSKSYGNIKLLAGEKMDFIITKAGIKQSTFNLTINNNNSATTSTYGYSDLTQLTDDSKLGVTACLTQACYDIEVTDAFLPHNSTTGCANAIVYSQSAGYNANQEVIYEGKYYRAKYFTKGETPGAPWNGWEYVGECNVSTDSDFFTLTIDSHTAETIKAKDFDHTNGYKKPVCIQTITALNNFSTNDENEITVYPNPTNGDFTISAKNISDYSSIKVSTTTGQIVHTQLINNESTAVSVSVPELKTGVYLIQLLGNQKTETIKINIQ